MTLYDDLAAAQAKLADDASRLVLLQSAESMAISFATEATAKRQGGEAVVVTDEAEVARIQTAIDDQFIKKPYLGCWPYGPDLRTWQAVRKFAPKVKAYRSRGTRDGRFDFPYDKLGQFQSVVEAGGVVSTNFNPRMGTGSKTAVKLLDLANGKYDPDLIEAGKWLANFDEGICEIWSECNVQKATGTPQPKPSDFTTANWEAAFLHICEVFRSNGCTLKLGTTMGPQGFQRYQTYVTPAMAAKSDFLGLDFYCRTSAPLAAHLPSVLIPKALKVVDALGIPMLAVPETGMSRQFSAAEIARYFTDLAATAAAVPSGKLWGVIYTNGDMPNSAYVIDPSSANHADFVRMAAQEVWA